MNNDLPEDLDPITPKGLRFFLRIMGFTFILLCIGLGMVAISLQIIQILWVLWGT